jgi:hypothetical protein
MGTSNSAEALSGFESLVMDRLLAGDSPALKTLRQQLAVASVSNREFSGIGFFTHFLVPETVERLAGNGNLTLDVFADLEGVESGAGFILFIKDGALDMLEGYVQVGKWPDVPVVRQFPG